MKRARRIVIGIRRRSRDILAVAGVACIAVGLATVSIALAWLAVGGFLIFAAGAGGRSAA